MPRPRRCPATRNSCVWRAKGIERLNEKYAHVRADIFYLFHRARRWNAQEGVWMGYERKRGKLADLNAMLRGAKAVFAEVVGQTAILQACAMSSRSIPTRSCRATRRARWWARSPIRSIGRSSTPQWPRRRWLHHSAAAGRRQPAQRAAVAFRATVRGRSGRRSVHARRLGCVPGSVWRRLVHRQGDLRRRFLRAALRRLSRERDPQPRLDRGRVLPFGPAQRCDAVRRASARYAGGHRPPASLDARRLADRRVAAAVGARAVGPARPQPDLGFVAVEDLRQPCAAA
jgi:hypothetical protein